MEIIKLSVRELAEFVYKGGDLNPAAAGFDRAMEGVKAHKILQSNMDGNYMKEVSLKYELEYKGVKFVIEGRADGIMTGPDGTVVIDEIKSTYCNLDIIEDGFNLAHSAQAKCYAYIYGCQNEINNNIAVQLRYYNIETQETKAIVNTLTMDELKSFFFNMLDMYMEWAEIILSLRISKRETIKELQFPFAGYRKGQREFSVAVFRAIQQGKKLFVQAPTGVGKTVSVLFPAIKAMNIKSNSKIFYLTAKSSTKTIAFNTVKLMTDRGLSLRTVVLTAKEKICFMDECNCDPEYCPYARGYYDRLQAAIMESFKTDCMYDREYIENMSKKHSICPFEYSLDLSYMSDIVICDYNYYFDPRVGFQREDAFKNTNDILLVDEAHNLEDRTRSMYSPEIMKEEFLSSMKLMKNIDKKVYKELKYVNQTMVDLRKLMDKKTSVLPSKPEEVLKSLRRLVTACEDYMHDDRTKEVPDELKDIYFKSAFFIKISEMADNNYCWYAEYTKSSMKLRIYLIDTSCVLSEIQKNTCASIFFSATLTPLKYFKYMLGGGDDDYVLKLNSPFERDNLKIMITAGISMKYAVRDLNIEKVCEHINLAVCYSKGNYMVFFPSYAFMSKVVEVYDDRYGMDNIMVQSQNMSEEEQSLIVDMFDKRRDVVLFAVVGGIFSEGIDLPLEKLIGAVIIGTGIPQLSFERDIIKNFFDEKFGTGFEFAYKYPGFNKILQSAGRVIRTEKDRGVVLLIDSRLCQPSYLKLYPEHWRHAIKIYEAQELREQLEVFWKGNSDNCAIQER